MGHLVYDDAAYMSLMKNFKALGYFEDYDSCYFQYRKEHRAKPWPAVNDGEEWFDGDIIDVLGFSITVFLSGTKLFIDPPELPRIEGRSRFWIKWAFIVERLLGGLFSILLFIAIGGTIVRAS